MAPTALPRTPRSLADDLRARSAGQITRLLQTRPDLLHPWPTDLGQLARRAADDASVLEAMQGLNTTELRVLEVFACLHEATADAVAAALPDDPDAVRGAVVSLWTRALIWGGPQALRVTRAAQQAFGPCPCGLAAATGAHRIDEPAVRDAAEQADPEELRAWVWEQPFSDHPHPLLVARGERYVLEPEVSLLLRGGRYLPQAPPAPRMDPVQPDPGSSLWGPIAGVRYLIDDLAREPLAMHPTRGVSRRTVTDRAAAMAVPADDLMLWLELAAAAGLIGPAGDTCAATPAVHSWRSAPPSQMWSTLIGAWLRSDRPLGACVPEHLGCLTAPVIARTAVHRRHILAVWPDAAAAGPDGMRRLVGWWRPRMQEAVGQVAEVVRELQMLGLLVGEVPTAALALLPDDVAAAATHLPGAQTGGLIVQPDQTVIAPVAVDTPTWDLLHAVTRVESWGPVTVCRVDPARLRSAVAGREADEVLDALAGASRTALPQSLEYAVRDAARSTPLRVYPATLVEAAAADVDTLRAIGMSEIGPRVFASPQDPQVVTQMLQAAGMAVSTVPEPLSGTPADRPVAPGPPDPSTVTRLVEHLVASRPPVDDSPPPLRDADPEAIASSCRSAIDAAQRVWLRYAQADGTRTELVEPVDLRSGRLTAWSLSAGRMVTVPLSKIAAFGSADD